MRRLGYWTGVLVVALVPALPGAALAVEGAAVFGTLCGACHATEAGRHKAGPSLAGVFGRKAGTAAGFPYSAAMVASGLTWDEATLTRYLRDPQGMSGGALKSRMAIPAVKDETEAAAIIAYLKTLK